MYTGTVLTRAEDGRCSCTLVTLLCVGGLRRRRRRPLGRRVLLADDGGWVDFGLFAMFASMAAGVIALRLLGGV